MARFRPAFPSFECARHRLSTRRGVDEKKKQQKQQTKKSARAIATSILALAAVAYCRAFVCLYIAEKYKKGSKFKYACVSRQSNKAARAQTSSQVSERAR